VEQNGTPESLVVGLAANLNKRLILSRDVHKLLWPRFFGLSREHLWRLDLNSRGGLLGGELISIGSVDGTNAHPREIFAGAIRARASKIILAHNHPSNDVSPSDEDLTMTARLSAAGLILGIELFDHLIIYDEKFFSLKDGGFLNKNLWFAKN
jgi:DNA repair protein RadC